MDKRTVKVCIFGGRDFDDYKTLEKNCDIILGSLKEKYNLVIVSGCARGADTLGEVYAKQNEYPVDKYPADWQTHGKSAGYIRNKQMCQVSDVFIGFWDGNSKGTKMMISIVENTGKPLRVVTY